MNTEAPPGPGRTTYAATPASEPEPLLQQPFAHVPALDRLRDTLRVNVDRIERVYSVVAGVAAIAAAVNKRSLSGVFMAAAGAALALRGITGHCHLYELLGKRPR